MIQPGDLLAAADAWRVLLDAEERRFKEPFLDAHNGTSTCNTGDSSLRSQSRLRKTCVRPLTLRCCANNAFRRLG